MSSSSAQVQPLRINAAWANELSAELLTLRDLGASQNNVVYSPLILNTVLIMYYLSLIWNNLFIDPNNVPYGGYQLTLDSNNADNNAFESAQDVIENEKVNELVRAEMESGKNKIAVSLMFIDSGHPENNHANMILFLKIGEVWRAYHYEPYGPLLQHIYPSWVETGKRCINIILERLGIIINEQYTYRQTRIHQDFIGSIQSITEGGYCQMISALQAYLFLRFCITPSLDSTEHTPLGSSINSPGDGIIVLAAQDQLQIIRGFVIFISKEINRLLFAVDINFSIGRISEISQFYNNQRVQTGIYRPLYLIYLDAVFKFIIDEKRQGRIQLLEQCQGDCKLNSQDIVVEDFGLLNAQMSTLLGLLNGAVVLTKAAKMQIYSNFRQAAIVENERVKAASAAAAAEKDKLKTKVATIADIAAENRKKTTQLIKNKKAILKAAAAAAEADLGTSTKRRKPKTGKTTGKTTGGKTRKYKRRKTRKVKRTRRKTKKRK